MTRDELIHRIKTAYNCGSAEGVASHYGEDTLHLRGQYLCQRDALLAEFDRLRDCERVVWCLTVGVKQRDSRIGRKTGPRTWMVRPFNPEEFVFCHLATDPANDFECNLGPNFSISESADPDRIRRIIDAEMAKEQGQ